jgi:hypothetical protein
MITWFSGVIDTEQSYAGDMFARYLRCRVGWRNDVRRAPQRPLAAESGLATGGQAVEEF